MELIPTTGMSSVLQGGYNGTFQYVLLAHLRHVASITSVACDSLKIEDFDLPTCQILWEAIQGYYKTYGVLPGDDVLMTEVVSIARGIKPGARTILQPEFYSALDSLYSFIRTYRDFDEAWLKNELPRFILWVRGTKLVADHRPSIIVGPQGVASLELGLAKLKVDVEAMSEVQTIFDVSSYDCRISELDQSEYIPTGIKKLDMYLSGGLARRTIGMVAACPGVGKTNTLVNLAVSASLFDYNALVITLEVEGKKIMQRYSCMAAGIPGHIMKTPASTWPATMDARYRSLRSDRYPAYRRVSISALADKAKQIYLREVEAEIVKWKAKCVKETGSDSNCALVCVDWVDLLASVGFDKNEPDYKRVCSILTELRKLGVKHNVAMWTATQAKAEAYNRAIIQLNDIAHGFAKAYPLDVSIGIGVDTPSQIRGNITDQGLEEDPEDPADDKHLVFTVNKNRDGAVGVAKVYQANTLRFFDSPEDAMTYVDSLDRIGTIDPIDTFMLSQRAGRSNNFNIPEGFNR